ncbi:uncharacterized protein EV422DRAFT_619218 [Fimicolochytrium jonesii]|uniref:uncharacterized protein n=1 Tax=Fimicolochytrium jonesii TaxID=1396493 RepID=UPI0022FE7DA0|nr:uncharacterized protein EV422DRAFT_619218 [Fimicolochytrium jonesii]KAI8822058.1 hypothetical protein EV422DRAFT_619218 [Fimicolochytrium jonesii]
MSLFGVSSFRAARALLASGSGRFGIVPVSRELTRGSVRNISKSARPRSIASAQEVPADENEAQPAPSPVLPRKGRGLDGFPSRNTRGRPSQDSSRVRSDIIRKLCSIPEIGPVSAEMLYDDYNVRTLEDLQKPNLPLKKKQRLQIKYHEDFGRQIPRSEVAEWEQVLKTTTAGHPHTNITLAGAYRRGLPSCPDITVVVSHDDVTSFEGDDKWNQLHKAATSLHGLTKDLKARGVVLSEIAGEIGDLKFVAAAKSPGSSIYRRVTFFFAEKDAYYCTLLAATGPYPFNRAMRIYASQIGYSLGEKVLREKGKRGKLGDIVPVESEEEIFKTLKLTYVKPEDRTSKRFP